MTQSKASDHRQIVALIARGKSDADIAEMLKIEVSEVRSRLASMFAAVQRS